jgi:hypothetical protein
LLLGPASEKTTALLKGRNVLLRNLVESNTRLYAKSEWGPAGPQWPALSFSRRAVANAFSTIFTRGTDFVISVGTSNPEDTQDPAHRQSLLSIVDVEPKIIVNTADLVDPEAWARAQQAHPDRWKLSMPIVRCWTITDFPKAQREMTATYQRFANPTTRGRPIRVEDVDRPSLFALTLTPIDIPPHIAERAHSVTVPDDILLNRELTRIVGNILNSVGRAGTERSGLYPDRHALNFSDLFQLLRDVWRRQGSRCNLCSGLIELGEENPLLKMSPDRIDSANKNYDGSNLHLTHVGCNLAKSSASIQDWQDFLDMLRADDSQGG